MASINQMFASMLSEGIKSTKAISDPEKKALACAELAKALAMTGLVSVGDSESAASEPTPAEAKESLKEKPKAAKKEKAKEEPKVAKEEPKAEEVAEEQEIEIVDEWTDEMIEHFSEQLSYIQGLQEEYDEETLDECVKNFSEGVFESIEDISPLNIDGFIAYFQMLLADAEEEAE